MALIDELKAEEQRTGREYMAAKLRTKERKALMIAAHADQIMAKVAYERAFHAAMYAAEALLADTAIAALEPAPAEPEAEPEPSLFDAEGDTSSYDEELGLTEAEVDAMADAEPVAPDVEIPEGFTKWEGGEWTGNPRAVVQVLFEGGLVLGGSDVVEDIASWWTWTWDGTSDRIIAYRIISQPADQSEEEPESGLHGEPTHDGSEYVVVEDELSDPEPSEIDAGPAYVGLQDDASNGKGYITGNGYAKDAVTWLVDPELDKAWDDMKRREQLDQPRSFWESLIPRKLEDAK